MSFPYKKVAVFGATSGIGRALAERFIENGISVIAIGRRKERLEELVQKYGHEKVQASPFDMTKLEAIDDFVQTLTSTHPDLDLVFLNSGVQYGIDFSKPTEVSLDKFHQELTLNYTSPIYFTKSFLPFLLTAAKEGRQVGLFYTTSALSLIPSPLVPNYSGTKAGMHAFILCLRAQLNQLNETNVKVLELYPPAVQTEIHGEAGKDFGMPLGEYIDAVSLDSGALLKTLTSSTSICHD